MSLAQRLVWLDGLFTVAILAAAAAVWTPGAGASPWVVAGRVSLVGAVCLAEGVETQAEADACRQLGFALAQGFLFGRPAPASEYMDRSRDEDTAALRG